MDNRIALIDECYQNYVNMSRGMITHMTRIAFSINCGMSTSPDAKKVNTNSDNVERRKALD